MYYCNTSWCTYGAFVHDGHEEKLSILSYGENMSFQDCLPRLMNHKSNLDMQGEFRASSKNFIVGAHPHGVFSFCGVCAAVLNPETLFRVRVTTTEPAELGGQVMTHGAPDGFGAALPQAFGHLT